MFWPSVTSGSSAKGSGYAEIESPKNYNFDVVKGGLYVIKGTPRGRGVKTSRVDSSAEPDLVVLGEDEVVRACGDYSPRHSGIYGYVFVHVTEGKYKGQDAYVMAKYLQPYGE